MLVLSEALVAPIAAAVQFDLVAATLGGSLPDGLCQHVLGPAQAWLADLRLACDLAVRLHLREDVLPVLAGSLGVEVTLGASAGEVVDGERVTTLVARSASYAAVVEARRALPGLLSPLRAARWLPHAARMLDQDLRPSQQVRTGLKQAAEVARVRGFLE